MIRAVGNKRLDLSEEEFEIYNSILSVVDKTDFNDTFESDNNGIIKCVFPPINKSIPMVAIYFLLNVMFNQRIRFFDSFIVEFKDMKKEIEKIKEKINEQ